MLQPCSIEGKPNISEKATGRLRMKLVKSLLLGTAAGFVAAAAAQAADLEADKVPKAADYVKVCSLYGEGFYQIPGEGDICIRIGATARLDGALNADGNGGPVYS